MAIREPFTTNRLFCPGPTPSPRGTETEADVYHRSAEFSKTFREVAESLGRLIGSRNQPVILASSGTGALEAAMVNLTSEGDRITVAQAGKFGERWRKLGERYGCQVSPVDVEWGRVPTPADILAKISPETKALFLQANETSTGVALPLESLVREIRSKYEGLIVVDAISSLGAHAMRMDEWQIDVVCGGSQKGFGVAPGLAFLALSDRAKKSFGRRPRFYFDLEPELKGQAEGKSAFTPAISLILAMKRSLAQMEEIGFDGIVRHHERLANAARAGVLGMGLNLFPKECPSNALTAIEVPAGIDGTKWLSLLRERFGMFFAGGQDALKGRIVRFAHLGFVDMFHVIDGLAALELGLVSLDPARAPGDGVKAALGSFSAS